MAESLYRFLKTECIANPSDRKIYFGRDITGEELLSDVEAVAAYLQSKGIGRGDVAAICLPNIPQAIVALYAVNATGATAYVLHPKTGAEYFLREIRRKKVKAVFLFDRFLKRYADGIKDIVTVSCRESDYLPFPKSLLRVTEPIVSGVESYKNIIKCNKKYEDTEPGEIAVYLNSGGTTGEPKTVCLSGEALNSLAINVRDTARECENYVEGMGMLMALPLFHGFGLGVCVHLGLLVGYVVPITSFSPTRVVSAMKKIPVNIIVGVPGMLRRLSKKRSFSGPFLKNTRLVFVGGDKLGAPVREQFESVLRKNGCHTRVMEGYGLSEVAGVAAINVKNPSDGALGQPVKRVFIEVFKDGKACPEGECGEIGVCSPSVMIGYADGSECEYFSDGERKYLATGDIGYKIGDSVYFTGRKKRMIKIGGVNVFPSQIEEVAAEYNGVEQACAVRISLNGKPAVKLLIVTKKEVGEDFIDGLSEHIGRSLIKYAVPKIIERTDFIKTTAIGKADYSYYERKEEQ